MTPNSGFIPIDSANKMIASYLNSINYQNNDTDLHAIIFNADTLRRVLNDSSNGKIASVKLLFAHTLDYINSGGQNHRIGYKGGAFTIVIAGYKANGDYVYYPSGKVADNAYPCPTSCPVSGNASGNLLPN